MAELEKQHAQLVEQTEKPKPQTIWELDADDVDDAIGILHDPHALSMTLKS